LEHVADSSQLKSIFSFELTVEPNAALKAFVQPECFYDVDDTLNRYPHQSEPSAIKETVKSRGKKQFVNQPNFPASKTARTGARDTVIPYLLLATPFSNDAAMAREKRDVQWRYVQPDTTVALYFSEPMVQVNGRRVELHALAPDRSTALPAVASEILTATVSWSPLRTKATLDFGTLRRNRLYVLLVEPGAFADDAGNAFPGINGRGLSYYSCVDLDTPSTVGRLAMRDCRIAFVVPMDRPEILLPSDDPSLQHSTRTSVRLRFSEPVARGSVVDAYIHWSGTPGAEVGQEDADSVATSDDETYFVIAPKVDPVIDADGEVRVRVDRGAFDYVDAFAFSYTANATGASQGLRPEVLMFDLQGQRRENAGYWQDAGTIWVGSDEAQLHLIFNARVAAGSGTVTFRPLGYEQFDPLDRTVGSCYNVATAYADLRPCRFLAVSSAVTMAANGASATIDPGVLIPGQEYFIELSEGAFIDEVTGVGTPEWSTKISVKQEFTGCVYTPLITGTLVHASTAFKLTFGGPVTLLSGDIKIHSGSGIESLSLHDLDIAYVNNDARLDEKYLIMLDPRVDGVDSLPSADHVEITIPPGSIQNLAGTTVCEVDTLYHDVASPVVESVLTTRDPVKCDPDKNECVYTQWGITEVTDSRDTVFKLTLSEKVVAVPNGPDVLLESDQGDLYVWDMNPNGPDSSSTVARIGGEDVQICTVEEIETLTETGTRSITLRLLGKRGEPRLQSANWTLRVPLDSLVDRAAETGVKPNFMAASPDLSNVRVEGTEIRYHFVVDTDVISPTCTVIGEQYQPLPAGSANATLLLVFSEPVRIADPDATIQITAVDGTVASEIRLGGEPMDSIVGDVQFNWLAGCKLSRDPGCRTTLKRAAAAGVGGGDTMMYVFANFAGNASAQPYGYVLSDRFALTDLSGNPLEESSFHTTTR
jgi:hypothetical protein